SSTLRLPTSSTLFPYTTLFRSMTQAGPEYPIEFIDPIATAMKLVVLAYKDNGTKMSIKSNKITIQESWMLQGFQRWINEDQRERSESTRLNSSHLGISYAVFCL